jgi:hypothetical protein
MWNEEKPVSIKAGKLSILVENLRRVNYGNDMFDEKGLLKAVKLHSEMLYGWNMTTIPLKTIE